MVFLKVQLNPLSIFNQLQIMERNSRRDVQVIQTAKLFIKFVEQLNRKFQQKKRQVAKPEKKEEPEPIVKAEPKKKPKTDRPKQVLSSPIKNLSNAPPPKVQEVKEDKNKRNELYSFNDQKPKDLKIPTPPQKEPQPPNVFPPGISFPFYQNPMFPDGMQFFAQPLDPINYPFIYLANGLTPDKLYYSMPMFPHQKPILIQQVPQPPAQPQPPVVRPCPRLSYNSEKKIFKRASYHAAIAYDIHLKKIKKSMETNKNFDMNTMDPTYLAKTMIKNAKTDQSSKDDHNRQTIQRVDKGAGMRKRNQQSAEKSIQDTKEKQEIPNGAKCTNGVSEPSPSGV